MQPKLLKTTQAEYVKVKWDGKNTSGVTPLGDRILLLLDIASDKAGSVLLPDQLTERHDFAAQSGVLVAADFDGAWVWNSDRTRPFAGRKPAIGERVIFEKYAGQPVLGNDGKMYRLMDDKCIAGIDE